MAFFWKVVLLIVGFGSCVQSATRNYRPLRYTIPRPLIQAFEPEGLRVSIPRTGGIQLFSFHGNINKPLETDEEGDLGQEVSEESAGGRWVYENTTVRLRAGDRINYRIYVVKDNLGYRLQHGTFLVEDLHSADDVQPPTTPAPTICHMVVSNLTRHISDLQQEIDSLRTTNDILKDLVEKDPKAARTLSVDGVRVPDRDLAEIVQAIVKEKLGCPFEVANVKRRRAELVEFEVGSVEEKVEVVRAARAKLRDSKFSIVY